MKAYPFYFLLFLAVFFFSCNSQPSENKKVATIEKSETVQTIQEDTIPEKATATIIPEPEKSVINKPEPKPKKRKLKKPEPVQPRTEITSTTLAAAPVTFTEPEAEAALTVADIYKHFEKAPQTFTISVTKDTTIICKEGTSLYIPANAFVSEKTGKLVTGAVQISVKEFYQLSDMLLANLSTTSGKQMLETGGMLHVTATSAGNENLILKPDQKIEIGFPYETPKPDMQLFLGDWKEEKMDWKLPQDLKGKTGEPYTHVEQMPVFPGGDEGLQTYFNSNLKFPLSVLAERITKEICYVQFVVDSTGQVGSIKVYQGGDSSMAKQAVYWIDQMPKWKPGIHNDKPVSVSVICPISMGMDGYVDVTKPSKIVSQAKALEKKIKDIKVVYINSKTIMSKSLATISIYPESNWVNTNNKAYKKKFEAKTKDSTLHKSSVEEVNGYLLSTSKLGWINCDRFYDNKKPKTDFVINTKGNSNSAVTVVFHSVKAIIPGQTIKDYYTVFRVPVGEKITIVALKTENNQIHLAVKETTIQKSGEKDLIFEPVTMAKLKEEMAKLNTISR